MRNAFFDELFLTMERDEDVFVLAADMGLGLLNRFQETYPDRFLNVGIAEQNMVGVAAGLVNAGFKPFCYTISNFLIHRAFEQVRNDICLHGYPITLVGTSTGYDNGLLGATHQVIDDLGCIKALPGMTVYSPSTKNAARRSLHEVLERGGPAYVRIGKGSMEMESDTLNGYVRDQAGSTVCLACHGAVLPHCLEAADAEGCAVYRFDMVHPLDPTEVGELLAAHEHIIVVEDHFSESGLYGSLCRMLVESDLSGCKLHAAGPPVAYELEVGNDAWFAKRYGYDAAGLGLKIKGLK